MKGWEGKRGGAAKIEIQSRVKSPPPPARGRLQPGGQWLHRGWCCLCCLVRKEGRRALGGILSFGADLERERERGGAESGK